MADVECTQKAPVNIEATAPENPISPTESVRYLTVAPGDPGPGFSGVR
jgi:hypothetical protein